MLLVATLWSLTSDLDKMGKQSASSFVVFVAVQRVLMGAPLGGALVAKVGARRAGEVFVENAGLLLALAIGEMYTMAAYLMALDHLFVSYAIAAKRSGILLSVLGGAVFFKESIRDRLPYVCVILVGMVLVLLSGGDGDE
jgi:drug/metabolite transporter (DMT)-like permease